MKLIRMRELRGKLGGRSRSAIYCDIAAGRIPKPVRLGGINLFDEAEVESALARLREGGSHEPRG